MDTLLLTFIEATDEDQADRCLARLIDEHAAPIVREILASSLRVYVDLTGAAASNHDAGDLFNDIVVNLISRLRNIKLDPEQESIADFRSYVAATAYNTCNLYLRQKFPRRSRLKNRLRYLLSHDVDFALWITAEFGLLSGFASWRDKKEIAPGRTLETITQDPFQWTERAGLTTVGIERAQLTSLLKAIFQWCGSPIRLDDLVNTVAEICRERDLPDESLEMVMNAAADSTRLETILEHQHYLALLWQEVCQLPLRQRIALLLNFRDAHGQELISLLPYTRTTTIEEIAKVLEFPLAEFLNLWNKLPLDDLGIAQLLGATRQQVINLRKCARQRLERRMGKVLTASNIDRLSVSNQMGRSR